MKRTITIAFKVPETDDRPRAVKTMGLMLRNLCIDSMSWRCDKDGIDVEMEVDKPELYAILNLQGNHTMVSVFDECVLPLIAPLVHSVDYS